ncbi:MAG TPA: PAS domain-containing protein [Caulobacteraceae bacterium]|nr:PAS domain-containing protein [Caulobacteraceae bacterium]
MAHASRSWFSSLPASLVPARGPGLLAGAAATAAITAAAWGLRGFLVGFGGNVAVTQIFYPALILATLYAGPAWGAFAGLALAADREAVLVLFLFSGAMTIAVSAALRALVRRQRRLLEEQAAAESVLGRVQTSMRLAQEAGGVGFWDWDLVERRGYWSPAIYSTLGLDPAEPASRHRLLDFVHPEDREAVRAMNDGVAQDGRVEPIEYRIVRPDGRLRWVLSRGDILRDAAGAPVRALGVIIDVTERHAAMERLAESEARFRALADSAPALMWVTRLDGKRDFVNAAYCAFAGLPYDEAVALEWRGRIHPDDLADVMARQQAAERGESFVLEARYLRADGEWRWLKSSSQVRFDVDGRFAGFVGIAFDDTDARRAQSDLERINELLQERVAAARAERDRAEAALAQAQKLEAIGRLTGGVAHDFNNLLTIIIGALDILQRHPDDAQRRGRLVEAALAAARRGERLNQQLLAFSRRQPLRPEVVEIDAAIAESEPLLRRAAGDMVTLEVRPGAPGQWLRLDVAQFEAALLNLLVNARDAMAEGGAVEISTEALALDLPRGDAGPGDYVAVTVRDTGPGMAPATIAQAFEPFFTTKSVGKGAGLGLSQVYGFARQSGGAAEIESAVGRGTSVRLLLPTVEPQLFAEAAAPAAPEARPRPLQVLLVEDDDAVADLVGAMLAELGHAVRRASDGVAARRALAEDGAAFDLALTDVVMPGQMNGLDLARSIATTHPELPVILISGYIGDALGEAERAPWPLLRKPFPLEDLARAIAAVVAGTGAGEVVAGQT